MSTDVRSFLGTCSYYRKYIKSFGEIAKPLYGLTEHSRLFEWNEKAEIAFQTLKEKLMSSPILAYPNENDPFILDCDASGIGLGAVLSQNQEGHERVISYFSKTLGKAERNYCVTRRELLAIVSAIKHYHHYLVGKKFLVRTDHGALRWLLSFKNPEGQVARWIELLGNYHLDIEHRPGRYHGNADGLSRRPCEEEECKQCDKMKMYDADKVIHIPVKIPKSRALVPESNANEDEEGVVRPTLNTDSIESSSVRVSVINNKTNQTHNSWIKNFSNEEMREAQLKDEEIGEVIRQLEKGEGKRERLVGENKVVPNRPTLFKDVWDELVIIDGVLHKLSTSDHWNVKPLIVLPLEFRKCALFLLHNSRVGAHLGRKKTLRKVRERYYWPLLYTDVVNWVQKCPDCIQKRKPEKHNRAPMTPHCIEKKMERVSMDILGPLPENERGNRYILCMGDHFTKWISAVPIPNQETTTIANAVIVYVISVFGVPKEIYTDQGRNFESKLFKELCDLLGIQKSRTVPYRGQSNGFIENFNKFLTQTLRLYCKKSQKDWDVHLPYILLAYRSSIHASTGFTPSEMMIGWNPKLPIDLVYGAHTQEGAPDPDEYVERQQKYMNNIHQAARHNAQAAREEQKRYYDRSSAKTIKEFRKGDKVWYYRPRRYPGRSPKLQKLWEGPYVIVHRLAQYIYRIGKHQGGNKQDMTVHVDKLQAFNIHDTDVSNKPVTMNFPYLIEDGEIDELSDDQEPEVPQPKTKYTKGDRQVRRPQWLGIP